MKAGLKTGLYGLHTIRGCRKWIRCVGAYKKARDTFEAFPPSHQREYAEWITEAKRDETRTQRLATTLEWLAAGKPRNWKYIR